MRLVLAALFLAACSTDTFVSPDAATESGTADAGPDAPACTPQLHACGANALCANFDDGTTGGFTGYTVGAASATVSPALFVSCPNGLATRLDTIDAGATDFFGGVVGSLTVGTPQDVNAKLAVQVVLPPKPPGEVLVFMSIAANQNASTSVSLSYISGEWQLRAGSTSTSLDPLTGSWNPITLKVHFTAGTGNNGSAELDFVNSSNQPDTKNIGLQPLSVQSISSVNATFGVGTLTATTDPTLVTYDDAVFSLGL